MIEVATNDDQAFGTDGSVTIVILPDTSGPDQNLAAKYTTAGNWLGHTEPGKRSDQATVTVMDDDEQAVLVGFGEGSYAVAEGGSVAVAVSLSADPGRELVVPLSIEDQGGVSVADYSGVPDSVTFLSGVTGQTFTFVATQDMVDDDGESVVLGFGTLPTGVTHGTISASAVTILDDDEMGVVTSPQSLEVPEGESASYTVVLVAQPTADVTISAIDPSNPGIAVDPETLTFTMDNWDQAQIFTVHADQDDDREDESAEVTHDVSGGGYGSVGMLPVAVKVLDDDPARDCPDVWCATVELADQSATDWGIYQLFYHRFSEPPSSISDPEFVYESRVHTITSMYLSPGIPPDSDSPPTGIQTEWSTFFVSILPGRWGQVPDTGLAESDYLNWTLHMGGVELPFSESGGPTGSDGRRVTFVWRGPVVQGLFSEWPAPTTYEVRIEETPYSDPGVSPAANPGSPRYLQVVPISADRLLAHWRAPAGDGGSAITGYRLQWKEAGDSWDDPDAVSEAQAAPSGSGYVTGLTEGVDYTVRVLATNSVGQGPPSEEYLGRPQAHTPEMTDRSVDGSLLTVTFDRVLDGSSEPETGAFEVLVNNGLRSVTGVSIRGYEVRLTLSRPVNAADEVHVRYLPPTDLSDPSSIRDTDGNLAIALEMFRFEDVRNETDRATLRPLTARFLGMPGSHNGVDGLTFRVEFSDSVWVERGTPRVDMLVITGGSATRGWWLDRHTGLWEFTVQPDSYGDVTIVLPANRACGTVGAPCAGGGRRLSNRLEITVRGPRS